MEPTNRRTSGCEAFCSALRSLFRLRNNGPGGRTVAVGHQRGDTVVDIHQVLQTDMSLPTPVPSVPTSPRSFVVKHGPQDPKQPQYMIPINAQAKHSVAQLVKESRIDPYDG